MEIGCSLIGKAFKVNHIPLSEGEVETKILGQYAQVLLDGKNRPPSLCADHQNFIGYDGVVVPIEFQAFAFNYFSGGIPGKQIVEQMKGQGFRQATAYELALFGLSPGFEDIAQQSQCLTRKSDSFMAITVNDDWQTKNGRWVSCVAMTGVKKTFRYFYAGNQENILECSFPISGTGNRHVVVGVKEEEG